MRWNEIHELPCSIARTLSVIGDRWTMLILRDCFLGTRRFDDFQKQIGMTRHVLADRLRKLVDHEILIKVAYQEKPARFEYRLTKKGMDLYPILLMMAQWGDTWLAEETGPILEYKHQTCGQTMQPILTCSECGEPIDPRQIRPSVGPGLQPYLDDPKHQDCLGTAVYRRLLNTANGNPV